MRVRTKDDVFATAKSHNYYKSTTVRILILQMTSSGVCLFQDASEIDSTPDTDGKAAKNPWVSLQISRTLMLR